MCFKTGKGWNGVSGCLDNVPVTGRARWKCVVMMGREDWNQKSFRVSHTSAEELLSKSQQILK